MGEKIGEYRDFEILRGDQGDHDYFYLKSKVDFPLEIEQEGDFLGKPSFSAGYRPTDGERVHVGRGETPEKAEQKARLIYPEGFYDRREIRWWRDTDGTARVVAEGQAGRIEFDSEEAERFLAAREPALKARREAREARDREYREAKEIALAASQRVPADTRKEDFLPFVTATLQYWHLEQGRALEADESARSFAIAGQQIEFGRDFLRLTGRDFDPSKDRITRAEIEALPITPPEPPRKVVCECLECGAEYPPEKAHLIDAGGMGCARCNH